MCSVRSVRSVRSPSRRVAAAALLALGLPRVAPVMLTVLLAVLAAALAAVDEERSLAQSNCYGLPAELLAEDAKALVGLLATEEGRRAAKAAALRTLLRNATDTRAADLLRHTDRGRRINLCESSWFDWLPWLPCRVQSPPPRPDFQDEERGGDSEGPLCYMTDSTEGQGQGQGQGQQAGEKRAVPSII